MTVLLFILLAAYLLLGKKNVIPLESRGMLALAALLMLQSACAVLFLIGTARRGFAIATGHLAGKSAIGAGSAAECRALLQANGFRTITTSSPGGVARFEKNGKISTWSEMIAHGGLLLALTGGFLNYGFGLTGSIVLGKSIAWTKGAGNFRIGERGIFVRDRYLDTEFMIRDLVPAGETVPSSVNLAWRDPAGRSGSVNTLKRGETFRAGELHLLYAGDLFLVFPTVMDGNFDFLAAASELRPTSGGRYEGRLDLAGKDAKGVMQYDPSRKLFRAIITGKDQTVLFDRQFRFNEWGAQGDFRAIVASMGHFSRFEIVRHSYRPLVLLGAMIAVAGLMVRMMFQRRVVIISESGEGILLQGDRKMIRIIARQEGRS
jgi:hypothetical protein